MGVYEGGIGIAGVLFRDDALRGGTAEEGAGEGAASSFIDIGGTEPA